VGELATGTGEANDFDSVKIGTGTSARTIDEIDMDGNNSVVTIVGQNDVAITGAAAAGGLTVETTKAFSVGGNTTATSDAISITADKITLTGTVGTENDGVTLTATNDVSAGAITVTNESGDLVDITGAKVTLNNITASDIALTATNDKAASSAGTLLAEGDLSVDSGTWTITSMTANDGTLTISGDANVTATNTDATEGITVTSSCDVDLGAVGAGGTVLNASGATGGVTASFGAGYASQVTVVTNTGADDITANNDVVFNIQTGAGKDTVTITSVDALTVVNAGADNDTLEVNDTDNDYSVYGGAGGDSFTLAADVNAKVYGDDGDDTFTLGNDVGAAIDGGNDTDTVVLAGGNDYSGDGMTWANIEKVNITAGSATIDATTFASDNTFELVGTGSETLTIGATAGVAATINASGVTTGGFSSGGVIINGDNQADTLTASNYSDTINGGDGDDKIYGGSQIDGGNDVLNGDVGNDTINGNGGIDIIDGGNGADVIDGGAGNDTITGGRGQDDMTGGAGSDTFIFVGGTGNDGHGFDNTTTLTAVGNDADVITDFDSGNDVIDLTKANDTGTGALVDEANGALISDDNEAANYAAVVTKAETAFAAGNDVYVSVDAFDSGDAYVFVDSDNSDTLTDNDLIIVLTGIDNTAEISNDDFSF
jgi:Ca2+-binding RTX toxin-like protein